MAKRAECRFNYWLDEKNKRRKMRFHAMRCGAACLWTHREAMEHMRTQPMPHTGRPLGFKPYAACQECGVQIKGHLTICDAPECVRGGRSQRYAAALPRFSKSLVA